MHRRRPPLGVIPEKMMKSARRIDLMEAILRYMEAGLPVDPAWVDEYNRLSEELYDEQA